MTQQEIEFRAERRTDATEKAANQLYLAAILAQIRPQEPAYVAAIDAAMLQRIGRQLNSIAVKGCNYGLTTRDEKRQARLHDEAATVAAWYGLTVTTDGDPRGYVLRLHGDNLPRNGMGDGFGVA